MKSAILERLGHNEVLVPALIAKALAANDRIKLRLSALQTAARSDVSRQQSGFGLAAECRAAGLDPEFFEKLFAAAAIAGGRLSAPGLGALEAGLWQDLDEMVEPLRASAPADLADVERRLSELKATIGPESEDTMPLAKVARLTSGGDERADTVHRLVMDLHKVLNRLAMLYSEEQLAGAHVHALAAEDRPLVEAFMRGLNETKNLKFGHPGLGTTAARSGPRLVIQNDIGETDAHVVMVDVENGCVTITYTDVHLERAEFFEGLLRDFPVQWSELDRTKAPGLREDTFYLVTGRLISPEPAHRSAFLETIGASLVFLIDWNKARKTLHAWVGNKDAVSILDWSARHRFGHRGFLVLGGAELVAAAVRHAAPARIGFGEQLDRALGRAGAVEFLKTVLRVSTEALLEGGSGRLARDRIEADLVRRLQRLEGVLLGTVICQLGLARDIGASLSEFVAAHVAGRPCDAGGLAASARYIEEKADKIALNARQDIERLDADPGIQQLVDLAEQTIDELEQAAFIASLAPERIGRDLADPLVDLCRSVTEGAEAAVRGAAAAVDLPEKQRVDSEDALDSVARLIDCEHRADAAERAVVAVLFHSDRSLRDGLPALEFARAVERATDRLAAFGHVLRARIVAELAN